MGRNLHRCPQCKTVGKVNRSKARGAGEKLRLRLMPVYGVYRCHNCNWRGWLLRSSASPAMRQVLIVGYTVLAVVIIAGIIYFFIRNWPTATYQY